MISEDRVTLKTGVDAENSALITEIYYILLHIKLQNFTILLFSLHFDKTNAALVSRRDWKNLNFSRLFDSFVAATTV